MPQKPGRTLILIACACAVFCPGAFIFGFPGIMRHYWQQAFNVGGSEVGQTIFFILIGATCFMYLCGRWQEKYGPGKLAALGAVLTGSSVIWLGRTETMTAVHAWAFLVGAASAFIYVPALTAVQRWYPERRGLVSGLCNMAFGLAAAVMSPVVTHPFVGLGLRNDQPGAWMWGAHRWSGCRRPDPIPDGRSSGACRRRGDRAGQPFGG